MATEPYVSHTEPDLLIPWSVDLVAEHDARERLARDITDYLTARHGFWYCLRHGQLRAWWRFL